MTKSLGLAVMLFLSAQLVPVRPAAADPEGDRIVRERELAFFEKATTLRRSIQLGWSPAHVSTIMGPPDVVGHSHDGRDAVETWWYHDYEIGIAFKNGAVSTWFFRFMLR